MKSQFAKNYEQKIKSRDRNKPCICGSGKKAKKCCLDSNNKYNGHDMTYDVLGGFEFITTSFHEDYKSIGNMDDKHHKYCSEMFQHLKEISEIKEAIKDVRQYVYFCNESEKFNEIALDIDNQWYWDTAERMVKKMVKDNQIVAGQDVVIIFGSSDTIHKQFVMKLWTKGFRWEEDVIQEVAEHFFEVFSESANEVFSKHKKFDNELIASKSMENFVTKFDELLKKDKYTGGKISENYKKYGNMTSDELKYVTDYAVKKFNSIVSQQAVA